jgi:mannose-6-phosphate isomerase
MNRLYPLKFTPLFKEKIWGGQRICTTLGLDFSPLQNCGEAWVLSGVEGSETKVANGFLKGNTVNELVEVFMDDLVGEKAFSTSETEFPILVKFIDSNDYLSVQVHPDDALAARRKLGRGKSEMWYILKADEGAELISGFKGKADKNMYLESLEKNQLQNILNVEKVSGGDVFHIPAGRIHALGPGILLAEIQQTSDVTYRIWDWDRLDEKGMSRELHTDLALDAIDFAVPSSIRTTYESVPNTPVNLVSSPQFTTNIISFDRAIHRNYQRIDSFVILVCVEGTAEVKEGSVKETLKPGEAMLVPAVLERIGMTPKGKCSLLEVYVI